MKFVFIDRPGGVPLWLCQQDGIPCSRGTQHNEKTSKLAVKSRGKESSLFIPTIRWRMLWCLCLGRGKGKQRLSKYGVCQVLISSAAKVCLSELLSLPPQSPPLASAHKTSSSSSKYNRGNYNTIIHWDKMQYSYLCAKTIFRNWTKLSARWLRRRSWHWPGGVKIIINV